jgi:uncharacterized membrane protein YvlD (DUF360 family)
VPGLGSTFLTLGLSYLVVNWFAFYLAAMVGPGFRVHSFLSAIVGSLVVGLVSSFVGMFGLLGSESRSALRQELFFYRIQ